MKRHLFIFVESNSIPYFGGLKVRSIGEKWRLMWQQVDTSEIASRDLSYRY